MSRLLPAAFARIALAVLALPGPPLLAAEPPPRFVPAVDYHQHLASPAGAALLTRPLPAIAVPADIAAVLSALTENWNKPEALRPLYTDDAIVLINRNDPGAGWRQGGDKASVFMGTLFARPFNIVPVMLAAERDRARLAGYIMRGEGEARRVIAYIYLSLVRDAGGPWRIDADNRTFEPRPDYLQPYVAAELLRRLDAAGIQQAVVLSDAYWFDSPEYLLPGQTAAESLALVRAENDWTGAQAVASGGRLIAFCSFNPLQAYALEELRRCKSSGRFRGLKLHLQSSEVDLHRPADIAGLRAVFAEANKLGLAITIHTQTRTDYDAAAAAAFIDQVLPAAPDVPVIIAHLWGGGGFAPGPLDTYVAAVQAGKPQTRNLYFDVAEAALAANGDKSILARIAAAIEAIGPSHILFGSDAVGSNKLPPDRAAAQFRADVPLSPAAFATIAGNVLPFLAPR